MYERLRLIEENYKQMQDKLISGNLDNKEMVKLLKESGQIEETVTAYRKYQELSNELNDLNEMIGLEEDHELIEAFKEEIKLLEEKN